jgi:hypothetical protein
MRFFHDQEGCLIVDGPSAIDRDFRTPFYSEYSKEMGKILLRSGLSLAGTDPLMGNRYKTCLHIKVTVEDIIKEVVYYSKEMGVETTVDYPSKKGIGGVDAVIKMKVPHVREASLKRADLFNTLNLTSNTVKFEVTIRPTRSRNGWLNIFYGCSGADGKPNETSDWFQSRLSTVLLSHDDHSNVGNIYKSIVFGDEGDATFNMREIIKGVESLDFVESVKEEQDYIPPDEKHYTYTVKLSKGFN